MFSGCWKNKPTVFDHLSRLSDYPAWNLEVELINPQQYN